MISPTQTLKKHSSDRQRYVMVINRALAYKWCGEDKIAKSIIYQEDWSASMAKFRLAEAIIHDNFDEAYKIMFEIGVNQNEVNKSNYRIGDDLKQ